MQSYFLKYSLVLIATLLFVSCDYDRKTTGWEYFDDMVHSSAYESYTPNPNFKDGKTMQPTIEGTIPRGFMPYHFEKNDEDRILAAQTLKNPLEQEADNLERGAKAYNIYCMQCHGDNGDGKGSLYTSGKYAYPPASLINEKMVAANEADIYHVITVGHGIMAEHGSMIRPEDRWKIAMYIKKELQK